MNLIPNVFDAVLTSLSHLIEKAYGMAPPLLAGMVLIVIGLFLAHQLRHLATYILGKMKVDQYTEKVMINHLFHRLGMGHSPTRVAGFLMYWGVFLMFLLPAADVMGVTAVRSYLTGVVAYLPSLLAGVIIMAGGFVLGRFFAHLVHGAAMANGMDDAGLLAKIPYAVMVVFSGLLALKSLGVDTALILGHIDLILGGIALGLAIAYAHSYLQGRPVGRVPLKVVKTKAA